MLKRLWRNRGTTEAMVTFLSLSGLFATALTMISGLLVAKWMLPKELGVFTGFNIIVSYLILGQLGIGSALSRELPVLIGENKAKEAEEIAGVAQFWMLWISIIMSLVLLGFSGFYFFKNNFINAAGFFTISILTFQSIFFSQYVRVLYRTNNDFNKLSLFGLVTAVVSFVSIFFVYKWSFYGLCLRSILTAITTGILLWYWRPIRTKAQWKKSKFKDLLKLGLPMFSIANVYGLWPVFQKTMIITFGGPVFLGLYALSTIVESVFKTITSSLSGVIYPKMSMKWGESKSITKVLALIHPILIKTVPVLFLIATIGWFLLPYFVDMFLSNYQEGVEAARWTLILGAVSGFGVYTNIYNVIKKQKDRLITYVSGIISWLISIYILSLYSGITLVIFPQAMLIGQLTIFIITYLNIRKYKRSLN